MTIQTTPHINLRGNARQALEFYRSVFGGHLVTVTYRDAGRTAVGPGADEILWGQVRSEAGFHVMAFDVPAAAPWQPGENAWYVSIRGETADEIAGYWATLSQGATILQPLSPSPWSPLYGMLKDAFGVKWVLDVAVAYAAS